MLPLQFPRMLRILTQGPQSHYWRQIANLVVSTGDPWIVRIVCSLGINLYQSYSVTFIEQFSIN
jgi:hypothetical protein